MTESTGTNCGGKGRKFGRHSRSGAMAAYNNSRRDLSNKEKKITQHVKENIARVGTTPRGTARAQRRISLSRSVGLAGE